MIVVIVMSTYEKNIKLNKKNIMVTVIETAKPIFLQTQQHNSGQDFSSDGQFLHSGGFYLCRFFHNFNM